MAGKGVVRPVAGSSARRRDRARTHFRPPFARAEPLEPRQLLAAGLLKDINDTGTGKSNPNQFTAVGDTVFFTASDGLNGVELWKSDGTAAGTSLVKDIYPGTEPDYSLAASSAPTDLTAAGGLLFFYAEDGIHGGELWKSDGTAAGTVMVKDIRPGSGSSVWRSGGSTHTPHLTAVGDVVYFRADDGVAGLELWRSDGTADGTYIVKDLYSQYGGADPLGLVNFNGTLVFTAQEDGLGPGLYRTDGTAAGTVRLADRLRMHHQDSAPARRTEAVVGDTLYFVADDGIRGEEVWKTDGTAGGTAIVTSIGGITPGSSSPRMLTAVGDSLYFHAPDSTNGSNTALWKSDGTATGTVRVTRPDGRPFSAYNEELAAAGGGVAYFTAGNNDYGHDLWRTDGTQAGTVLVVTDPSPTARLGVGQIAYANGFLYYSRFSEADGPQLWKTSDATAGTLLHTVPTIIPYRGGTSGELIGGFTPIGGNVWFHAWDAADDVEPWTTDGTPAGTRMLDDLNRVGGDSVPQSFFASRSGAVYFAASRPDIGQELWRTDGTAAGTALVADLNPGGVSSAPGVIAEIGGKLIIRFFDQSLPALRLVVYDPETGTPPVLPPYATLANGASAYRQVGQTLYVATYEGTTARLWRIDDPMAPATLVAQFTTRSGDRIERTAAVGATLYFVVNTTTQGAELWKTDGTAEGTAIVKDIRAGTANTDPSDLTASGGKLFFSAPPATGGTVRRLWVSDGTASGTVALAGSEPGALVDVNGTLYFSATDSQAGRELWKSDGTLGGTVLVQDLSPGRDAFNRPFNSDLKYLTPVGGKLFFTTRGPHDSAGPRYLWLTDGTGPGTRQLRDAGARPLMMPFSTLVAASGDRLFFAGMTSIDEGHEPWVTDGTPGGSQRLADVRPGPIGSQALPLGATADAVYFWANDGVSGIEPWRWPEPGAAAVTVAGRYVFYNNSTYDGRDPAATAADLAAVAPGKVALLPGQAASFANVTSYSRGINGVLVDFAGVPPQPLTADDFAFRVRGASKTSSWLAGPAASIAQIPSPAGANVARYALTWPDGAVRNGWLEVAVKAGARTGLGTPDVFYFGNLVGETGGSGTTLAVTGADVLATRAAAGRPTGLAGRFDFNRDGRVNAIDVGLVRAAAGRTLAGPFDRAADPAVPTPGAAPAARLTPRKRSAINPLLA